MTAEETTGFIQRGTIRAVCVSERKGVRKKEIPEVRMTEGYGIEGDAHAGKWHRQVSLLSFEAIEEFKKRGMDICGEDGEYHSITVDGPIFKTPMKIKFKTPIVGGGRAMSDVILED